MMHLRQKSKSFVRVNCVNAVLCGGLETVMAYKIAIASTDGKVVNQHFGRADKFYIVEVDDEDEYDFVDIRETERACQGSTHNDDGLARTVELLSDCRYVLISQIGSGAEYALSKRGVTAFVIPHYIEDAVKKLIYYNSEIKLSR